MSFSIGGANNINIFHHLLTPSVYHKVYIRIYEVAMFFIFITKRPTPPLFLGGAEITHNFLAQNLTKMKHRVLFVGSIENPTFRLKKDRLYTGNF